MNLIALIFSIGIGSFNYSSHTNSPNIECSNYQQYPVRAYLLYQGTFVEGTINVQRSEWGLVPTVYNFRGIANRQTSGTFFPNTSFTPLNPNNQYALKYNFTHTISIPNLGTAFVTL